MPECDACRPGFSAPTAVLLRAIAVETTIQVGEHVVASLCGMTKFFDHADLEILGQYAIAPSFPV